MKTVAERMLEHLVYTEKDDTVDIFLDPKASALITPGRLTEIASHFQGKRVRVNGVRVFQEKR